MISGIHLATALSVMLHMEHEGNGMDTKTELLIGRLKNGGEAYEYSHNLRVVPEIYALEAADRLSEQQQVIDELVKTLEEGAQVDTPEIMDWAAERFVHVHGDSPNVDYVQSLKHRAQRIRDALSRAKGHTKDAE